ncbi:ABC transporter substrate-binding protein [Ramlibacter pallidus]|uniref:ABC transporter substrate-binding protein n=1 Tax=Ramlibacter pallidus TaxID=2780087 RepID=UPI00338F87F8
MGALLLSCVLGLPAPTQAAPIDVTDDRGTTVTLPAPPRRIVTLLPSLGETVCALGACDRLVAVDDFANWPPEVARLPHVGGVDDARIESIVALRPDLVLLSSTARALPRLQALGVPVLGLDVKTLGDVQRVLGKVGQALGVDPAPVWQRIEAGIGAAVASVPPQARGRRVYFEVGGGYAASASSHIGEILGRLGAVNIVPGALGTVPQLNPEFVVRADPDLVIVGSHSAASLAGRPGWSKLGALRTGAVCVMPPQDSDVVMRPGPRSAEAAAILARCLATPVKAQR